MSPNVTDSAISTHPAPLVVTVESAACGPYIGAPGADAHDGNAEILFTRQTAEQIVSDIPKDVSLRGSFQDNGVLLFTWGKDYDGDGGTHPVHPDAHGRYAIGGQWPWMDWNEDIPQTVGQAAYADGAAHCNQASTPHRPAPLERRFAEGRSEARRVTLRPDES